MPRVLVTYKVKADRVKENEDLVKAVYAELHQINNPEVHYATFKKEDGQTFVHINSFATPEIQSVVSGTKAFGAFQKNLKERCEIPPDVQPLSEVGSYNFV